MVQRFTPLLHNDMDRYRDVILRDMSWCKGERYRIRSLCYTRIQVGII